jgi:ATP-dependent DNA ligase
VSVRTAKRQTPVFPEIAAVLSDALPGRRVSLDGEIVAVDPPMVKADRAGGEAVGVG